MQKLNDGKKKTENITKMFLNFSTIKYKTSPKSNTIIPCACLH